MSVVNAPSVVKGLKLIPDQEQQEVISWGQELSKGQWWLGRLVQARIDLYPDDEPVRMSLYQAYGVLAGLSARTIRAYVSVCRRFPDEVVERYSPLPFSHFQFAAQFGDNAEVVLQESLDKFTQLGRPPSREWLEWRFTGYDFSEQPPQIGYPEEMQYDSDDIGQPDTEKPETLSTPEEPDETHKPYTFDQARKIVSSLREVLATAYNLIPRLPIVSSDKKAEALEYISKLKKIIEMIDNEIG
jgi:hypothetical protein